MPSSIKTDHTQLSGLINSPFIQDLAHIFDSNEKELYLVGGSVRDALLGSFDVDLDFATNADPKAVKKLITGWADTIWTTGARFGTIAAKKNGRTVEITTYRQESYDPTHRKPDVVFASNIDVDLSRRDFTINTMAIKLPEGTFYDPFNGLKDLENQILKTPLEPEISFSDDPLRMLRALRFVSYFDLVPEPRLIDAIKEMRERIGIVSRERIRDELSKLIVSKHADTSILLMISTGLSSHLIPELDLLSGVNDPEHKHKDLLEHTLSVLMRVERPDGSPETGPSSTAEAENTESELEDYQFLVRRLAALLHDIGKPATKTVDASGVHFHKHELVSASLATRRLSELKFKKKVISDVRELTLMHMRFHTYRDGWTDKAVRRYVRDAGNLLDDLNALIKADCTSRNPRRTQEAEALMDELIMRIHHLEEEEESAKIRPPVDGNEIMEYLGLKPGPQVGVILKQLLEMRLEGKISSKEEAFQAIDEMDLKVSP